MISFPTTFGLVAPRWRRALVQLATVVCLGAGSAAGQAVVEYGGAVATVGASETGAEKSASAHMPMHTAEDIMRANRRALEGRAGKDAAKLMLRSAPIGARVWIDGKAIGTTPLQIVVAPGVYKVEMEATRTESSRQQVDLLPKEAREVFLTLASRYPTHVELSWHRH